MQLASFGKSAGRTRFDHILWIKPDRIQTLLGSGELRGMVEESMAVVLAISFHRLLVSPEPNKLY